MKAPTFAYAKPRTLEEAFDLIERPGVGWQRINPGLRAWWEASRART